MSSFGHKRVNEQIETVRLRIRPLDTADAVSLHDAVVESKHSLAAWLDWCNDSYDLDDATNWITESTLLTTLDHSQNFGIFLRVGSPALVGCVGLSAIDPKASVANLGYWIRTSMQGRGFAKEAAISIARYGHTVLGLDRVEIAVHPLNLRSECVARAIGAIDEGIVPSRIHFRGERVPARVFRLG